MKRVFIIAEAGVNHNGRLDLALKLCEAAKLANADAVKFQTFITEKIVSRYAKMADYQKKNMGGKENQFKMLKKLELSFISFKNIKKHCDNIGIEFLSTPDDPESLDFLLSIGMKKIKIGSAMITNVPFLKIVGFKRKEVILSTGMSNLNEIKRAYNILKVNGARHVSLLHCTTNYPCPMQEVNLKVIPFLEKTFHTDIGYSDHTLGIEVSIAAVALGARIIEKHLTLSKNYAGPDHLASILPYELKSMVTAIRNVEVALGNCAKKPTKSELDNIIAIRRSIVAAKDMKRGDIFTEANTSVKVPGNGMSPSLWETVIGKCAKRDFKKDQLIEL